MLRNLGNVVYIAQHLLTSILNPVSFTSVEASEHCILSILGLSPLSCFSNLLCEVKQDICGLDGKGAENPLLLEMLYLDFSCYLYNGAISACFFTETQ